MLDVIHSEDVSDFEREYVSQGIVLLGLYKLSCKLVDIPTLISLYFLYFDGSSLMQMVKHEMNKEEREYYTSIEYLNGNSPILTMRVERMIWGAFDSLRLSRYSVLSYCEPLEIEFKLPKQFEHLRFYSDIKKIEINVIKENLKKCVNSLPSITQGVKAAPENVVYDVVTMGLFMLLYIQEEKSLISKWNVDNFLAFYQPMKRMIG